MTGDSSSTSIVSSFSRNSFSRSSASSSCSSPNSFPSEADVTSLVPFLWEEKPGVSKLETRKFGAKMSGHYVSSSEKLETTVSMSLLPMADNVSVFPPLRPPPRLQISSQLNSLRQNRDNKLTGARANVISHSLSRRRQHRRSKSDDDPFWLAMKVCTNEGTGNFDPVSVGMKDAAALLKGKDQLSLDFPFSFKVPVHRENKAAKNSRRTRSLRSSDPNIIVGMRDKQAHALQSSEERVAIPALHGKDGQAMADSEVSWKSGEVRTDVVSLTALQRSRNRPSRHSFDPESEVFEPNAYADGRKGIRITAQARQYTPKPVELSCGLRVKLKTPSNKQFLPDLLNCKSVNLVFNSVIDPALYRGSRV